MNKLLDYLLNYITIEIAKDKEGSVYYNLNTGMKSYAHAYKTSNKDVLLIKTLHGQDTLDISDTNEEYIIDDLCTIIKDCMCGRIHMNIGWKSILVDNGDLKILTKDIE